MHSDHARFHIRIIDELRQIDEGVPNATLASSTVKLDQSGVGRLSRMDALQQQAMAMSLRERMLTRQLKLRAALDRVTGGCYGLCCQCDDEIEDTRLESDPASVFCARCMTEREIHGDRIGDR